MDDSEILTRIVCQALEIKMWITRNGPDDINPAIFWHPLGFEGDATLIEVDGESIPEGMHLDLVGALPEIFVEITRRLGRPRMVVFVSEAYCVRNPDGGPLNEDDPWDPDVDGTPSELFRRGDPRAKECINIAAARLTRRSDCAEHVGEIGFKMMIVPFHYADGEVQFEEAFEPPDNMSFGGRLTNALSGAFEIGDN